MRIIEMIDRILDQAQFVDMTRMLEEGMPYWPTQPPFETETLESLENGDSSYFRKIVMCEHTGTHIDAGCHFVAGMPAIDEVPVTQIFGRAVNMDVTDTKPCGLVTIEKIRQWEQVYGEIREGDVVFLRFGWDEKYGTEDYMKDWPGLSIEGGRYLHEKGVKAIGCDCLALDAYGSTNPNHSYLLGNGVNILENVDQLKTLPPVFSVIGLPCKFKGGSGSPIRLIGMVEKERRGVEETWK